MPFTTDPAWTPTTYRAALAAWQCNAPDTESKVMPRKAARTSTPRHGDLSKKLRALLTWRAATSPKDWTLIATNDNKRPGEPELIDSDYSIRPRISAIYRALKDVDFAEHQHAKLGGGGKPNVLPIGGDIERGPVWRGAARGARGKQCVIRLGGVKFSNGANEEAALIRDAVGGISRGSVRIQLGGITGIGRYKAFERFGAPKGAHNDSESSATVGISANANSGAFSYVDPIEEAEHASWIRQAVKPETAEILDFALTAANFREIGERLGYVDKAAERRGQKALIAACAELEAVLAA